LAAKEGLVLEHMTEGLIGKTLHEKLCGDKDLLVARHWKGWTIRGTQKKQEKQLFDREFDIAVFRWLGDVTTIEAFESGALDMKDFYFTGDDYRERIEIDAKRRLLELLKNRFNSGVRSKGKTWKWDTVILKKTQELARFLLGKSKQIDFIEPSPSLQRSDTRDLRNGILEMTQAKARKLGMGKSTLHYLRRNASDDKPFKIYEKVVQRLR